jgi:hypothetical protein
MRYAPEGTATYACPALPNGYSKTISPLLRSKPSKPAWHGPLALLMSCTCKSATGKPTQPTEALRTPFVTPTKPLRGLIPHLSTP